MRKWKEWNIDWGKVNLILSGSPCQDLSAASGKGKGITGSRSNLFFVFVEILEHIRTLNPNVIFFQENVGSANVKDIGIMSRALGVYPVRINSELVTAQLRDRYYWTNIRTKETMFDIVVDIPQPKDKGIMFKDIITSGRVDRAKCQCIGERYIACKLKDENEENGQKYLTKRINTVGSCPVVYTDDNKLRTLNKIEMCRLQGFPDNYCDIIDVYKAGSLLGDGWTLPIIEHFFSFMKK